MLVSLFLIMTIQARNVFFQLIFRYFRMIFEISLRKQKVTKEWVNNYAELKF